MRISLRVKPALVSLLLLFIPLTGFRFSELIKQDLLESRRKNIYFPPGRLLPPAPAGPDSLTGSFCIL